MDNKRQQGGSIPASDDRNTDEAEGRNRARVVTVVAALAMVFAGILGAAHGRSVPDLVSEAAYGRPSPEQAGAVAAPRPPRLVSGAHAATFDRAALHGNGPTGYFPAQFANRATEDEAHPEPF